MTTLSDAQIAGAAKTAGFSGDGLVKIVAIALAESSGDPTAHNAVPPDDSYGLTQVNMLGGMGPERRKRYNLKSNNDLFDPVTNMKVAYDLSNGGKNFGAWSTYPVAYLVYLNRARTASGNPSTAPTGTGVEQVGSVIPGVDEASAFFDFITDPHNWFRLAIIVGGGILLLVSLALLSGEGSRFSAGVSALTNAIPGGSAVKSAVKG